ncbi:MAG: hypothetical protein P8X64_12480 [Anaerolineales bacterium]|jgi:heme-degrading monooxygenase HmoA
MSGTIAYAQVVEAVIPRDAWDETYFSLISLKSHIQSLPGWQRFDLWARNLEDGDVKLVVVTNWDHAHQLEQWLKKGITPEAVLRTMKPELRSINVDVYEEIA